MSLSTVTSGNTVYAQDLNQLIQSLQPSPGGSESGNFYVQGNAYTSSSLFLSDCVGTKARGVTPVSISITAGTPSNVNAPLTGHLKDGSVQIYAKATSQNVDCKVSGSFIINY